jgi:serine/threonine protein kinase
MHHLALEGVCHRDLACRNILLDSNLKPKITDFGMSRFVHSGQEGTTNTVVGPLKW